MTAESNKYKEENDAFAAFCQECLVREIGAELRANQVLASYKDWSRYNTTKKIMPRAAILQKMTETYGVPIEAGGKVFVGVRLAGEEDVSGNLIS